MIDVRKNKEKVNIKSLPSLEETIVLNRGKKKRQSSYHFERIKHLSYDFGQNVSAFVQHLISAPWHTIIVHSSVVTLSVLYFSSRRDIRWTMLTLLITRARGHESRSAERFFVFVSRL